MKMMKKSDQGFTLIELLVVVAIAGIFLAFMISTLGAGRQRSIDAKNMQAIALALAQAESYFASNNGYGAAGAAVAGNACGGDTSVMSALSKVTSSAPATCTVGAAGVSIAISAPSRANPTLSLCADSLGFSSQATASTSLAGVCK